jgi:hypothetical protein
MQRQAGPESSRGSGQSWHHAEAVGELAAGRRHMQTATACALVGAREVGDT